METKKEIVLSKILQLTWQDEEFKVNLLNLLFPKNCRDNKRNSNEHISQIYEYCIERVVRNQAKDFYKGFPLHDQIPALEEDFVRMEFFRRKDNFEDFSLAVYQQIERITNQLCINKELVAIFKKMLYYPAYIGFPKNQSKDNANEKIQSPTLYDRPESSYTIAKLIFFGKNPESEGNNTKKTLQDLTAIEKIRSIAYFIGYKASMTRNDFLSYKELTSLLYNIYQCRNLNHRGGEKSAQQQENINRILSLKTFYYFKFMGALAQYVDSIKNGYPFLPEIEKYATSLDSKEIDYIQTPVLPGIVIKGKIDLSNSGKKKN